MITLQYFINRSTVSKPLIVSQQNLWTYLYYSDTPYFFTLSSLSFLNNSLKLLCIVTDICRFNKRQPFMVPFYISDYLKNSSFLNMYSRLRREKYLSIASGYNVSIRIKTFNCQQELRPTLYIHTRNQTVKTQTESDFSILSWTKWCGDSAWILVLIMWLLWLRAFNRAINYLP